MSSIDSTISMQQSEEVYLTTSKFDSYDDLLKSAREFYYSKGYGISIRGSRKDKHVILQCDKGGSYRDLRGISTKRKKTTGSCLINCPFKIVGKKCSDGSDSVWIFKIKDLSHDEGSGRLDELLNELRSTYQRWPLNKKEHVLSVITKLVNQSDTVFEPVIQRPKGRPPTSKKKRGITSTTRGPSRFELVESSQSQNKVDGEINLIDLNVYPSDTFDLDGPF